MANLFLKSAGPPGAHYATSKGNGSFQMSSVERYGPMVDGQLVEGKVRFQPERDTSNVPILSSEVADVSRNSMWWWTMVAAVLYFAIFAFFFIFEMAYKAGAGWQPVSYWTAIYTNYPVPGIQATSYNMLLAFTVCLFPIFLSYVVSIMNDFWKNVIYASFNHGVNGFGTIMSTAISVLIVFVVAQISGIQDLFTLVAMIVLTILGEILLYLHMRENATFAAFIGFYDNRELGSPESKAAEELLTATPPLWFAYIASWIPFLTNWAFIIAYNISFLVLRTPASPRFWVILTTMIVVFVLLAFRQVLFGCRYLRHRNAATMWLMETINWFPLETYIYLICSACIVTFMFIPAIYNS
jgi:hypothetical protein